MTYAQISEAFDRCYDHLREVNGEHAPSSYTWVAPTLAELREDREDVGGEEVTGAVGYTYECNGDTVTAITADWSVEDVEDHFWGCFGFDESFPRD